MRVQLPNEFAKVYLCISLVYACTLGWSSARGQVGAPTGLTATAYDHHIELSWNANPEPTLSAYRVYEQLPNGERRYLANLPANLTRYIDFVGDWDVRRTYQVTAVVQPFAESAPSDTASATTFLMTDEQLLDMVQAYTFRYFWDFAHPVSGLARERNTTGIVTSGGSGFGVMAILVGIERGFITYEQGLARLTKIVDFLTRAPKFHGAFPHWMNGATGAVQPFSDRDNGGDLVETAFLIQGLLTVRQYFTRDTPEEVALREKITAIWEGVDWNWYRKLVGNVLYWHWSPQYEFAINHAIRGFNETHIVYILAIASPVEAFNIPASLYHTGWAGGNYRNGAHYYGYPLEVGGYRGGPLFFSHYSYLGFDPRNKRDRYTNYFNRNTYHTLINRAHCIANPYDREGYSEENWGLTASDDPNGYLAHAPDNPTVDNGTIAPTAALSSMPYTPEFSLQALKYFYRVQGEKLWGIYGFYDAFNLERNWFADSYLAIDQGPIICMIENYRTGLLWELFMRNPEIQPALDAIGFEPDSTVVVHTKNLSLIEINQIQLYPNPAQTNIQLNLQVTTPVRLDITLIDGLGRPVKQWLRNELLAMGPYRWNWPVGELPPGLYGLVLQSPEGVHVEPVVIQ